MKNRFFDNFVFIFRSYKINNKNLFFSGIKNNTRDKKEENGVIIIIFNINKLMKRLSNIKIYNNSVIWLFSHNGKKLYQPNGTNTLNPHDYLFKQKEKPENAKKAVTLFMDIGSMIQIIDPKLQK